MRNIFIDCGAWTGDSVKAFKKREPNYEIFAFECEPRLTDELTKLSKNMKFKFINKAVWVFNGTLSLYPGQGDLTQSSSLHKEKKKFIDRNNPVKVKSIDFSNWIINNFDKEDNILCKMNIEGAEYQVLPMMLKTGAIDYINKLYMSWHWRKIKDYTQKMHDDLVRDISKRTELVRWLFVENEKEDVF